MLNYKNLVFGVFTLTLAACGGGGSNSGGPVVAPTPAPPAGPSFTAGRYGGTQDLTLSVPSRPDLGSETNTVGFEAEVTSNSITILDSDITNATGSLDAAGNFAIPNARLTLTLDDGTPCMGELGYNGQVVGSDLSGGIVGSINCSGITFSVDGASTATLNGVAGKITGPAVLSTIRDYINRTY